MSISAVRRAVRRRALRAARLAGILRERLRPAAPAVLELEGVRRRIELLLVALYERSFPIGPVAERRRGAAARVARAAQAAIGAAPREAPLARNDGESIRLPARLDARAGVTSAVAEYQLLALEQAERVARRTADALPPDVSALERDLYHVAEGCAADAALLERSPRLASTLAAARHAALAARPPLGRLNVVERAVERFARLALGARPAEGDALPPRGSAADSLRWARAMAASLQAPRGYYTGLAPVRHWGAVPARRASGEAPIRPVDPGDAERRHGARVERKSAEEARRGGPQDQAGISQTALDDPRRAQLDARGLVGVRAEGPADAHDASGSAAGEALAEGAAAFPPGAVLYREWDCYARRFRPAAVAVVEPAMTEGDAEWAARSLRTHAALVRDVKHRFGKLRAQRARLHHQRSGEELDLAAFVEAITDARAGRSPDDRLYLDVRPARRGLAIALLVDVSGSTDAPVTDTQQIIDVEKDAMLFASEALDALGDRYAVLAFSGRGASQVRVTTVKGFAEPNGEPVRRRMAALAPDANTRLGAAVRHASALLAREPAGHRLLLVLSDGRPNDVGHYQGEYAVEDTRQAVLEARASGIYPYCLGVDREEPEYLARIFGEAGHAVLRSPAQLPTALLRAVRQLLGSR